MSASESEALGWARGSCRPAGSSEFSGDDGKWTQS